MTAKEGENRVVKCVIEEGKYNDGHINVGASYQAAVPDLEADKANIGDKYHGVVIWEPPKEHLGIGEGEIDQFVEHALRTKRFSEEQSLVFLCHHDYDIEKAKESLKDYVISNNDITQYAFGLPLVRRGFGECPLCNDDCSVFEASLLSHGKDFNRIAALLGNMSVPETIEHYYQQKRFRSQTSTLLATADSANHKIRENYKNLMSVPHCKKCFQIRNPVENNEGNSHSKSQYSVSTRHRLSQQAQLLAKCDNCQKLNLDAIGRKLPEGVYFNMDEFLEIVYDEELSKEKDRAIRTEWVLAMKRFHQLKQKHQSNQQRSSSTSQKRRCT